MFKKVVYGALILLASQSLVSCGGGGGGSAGTALSSIEFSQANVLSQIGNGVIIPAYEDLVDQFTRLNNITNTFCAARNDDNLDAVREAWRDAIASWSFINGVELGPVGESLRIRVIQTFPEGGTALSTQVNAILAGSDTLDATFFSSGSTQTRGLPAIEFLLFEGVTLADYTAIGSGDRRCDYIGGASENLVNVAQAVLDGWLPGGGNFIAEFTLASGTTTFTNFLDVIDVLANDLRDLTRDIATRKLDAPLGSTLGAANPMDAESSRSLNSVTNILNNLDGLLAIYLGGDSNGLDDYLLNVLNNTTITPQVLTQIDATGSAAVAVRDSGAGSIAAGIIDATDRALVETLLIEANALADIFGNDVLAALSVTPSFNEDDGD